ncbi:hypothetical protein QML37_30615, partial [Klebsiella pneumoniae]|uniref:hypothetical protein n=1 Tax=Klebsiella pneumoniae TaxID=573 RepID=UPI003A80B33D
MAYEVQLHDRLEEETKKKTLAFKAISDSENSDEEEDEEIHFITHQFRKFMKNRFQQKMKKVNPSYSSEVKCFNCKKAGHIKKDCPFLKTKPKEHFKKKKAFQACWDDSDSSSDEEEKEETTNVCLVAHEEQVSKLEFDEL